MLVAFQTEDRSPLFGHATPLSAVGQTVPSDPAARLRLGKITDGSNLFVPDADIRPPARRTGAIDNVAAFQNDIKPCLSHIPIPSIRVS